MIENEKFIQVVNESLSMREASQKLGMKFTTFVRKAKKLGVYKPNQYIKKVEIRKYKNLYEAITNSKPIQTSTLKKYLLVLGIFKDECYVCGFNSKRFLDDKYSVCELHHIDGNSNNNNLKNLILLCPNHHALTNNFRSCDGSKKSILDIQPVITEEEENSIINSLIEVINKNKDRFIENENRTIKKRNKYKSKKENLIVKYSENGDMYFIDSISNRVVNHNNCKGCKTPIPFLNAKDEFKIYCNRDCQILYSRKVDRPEKDVLLDDILSNSLLSLSKKYGVSDNTIRNWCKQYGLPYTKKSIEEYKKSIN